MQIFSIFSNFYSEKLGEMVNLRVLEYALSSLSAEIFMAEEPLLGNLVLRYSSPFPTKADCADFV